MTIADALHRAHPEIEVHAPSAATLPYLRDAGTRTLAVDGSDGPTVAYPTSAAQVQDLVRTAATLGVTVVARGAGTGLSGGASAAPDQLVVSTERLTRIVEVSPLDELAVVEPGVVNADLNRHLEPYGLFYAPDPASFEVSTVGGNVATNAGGLRCAKYGVTRESVLALDVVLADGSLVSVGHRSIKGVTGLDLVSLVVGSEGTLGIVVGITVRLRPVPVERRTLSVFFPDTATGVAGLAAITSTRVRPAVVELLDEPTLRGIDAHSGSRLRERGGSLVLVELDGYGVDEQQRDLAAAFERFGGTVTAETPADAEHLWHLRRHGRGFDRERRWFVGEDIAVPRSALPAVFAYFPELERRFGVEVSAVAHAGDGNLHPAISREIGPGEDPASPPQALADAATELVRFALSVGGTVSGEHGLGTVKLDWATLELSERSIRLQQDVRAAFDPAGTLNPGKAVPPASTTHTPGAPHATPALPVLPVAV